MSENASPGKARIVIAGGGVAGIETLLALSDLAGDGWSYLLSPEPDFLYKPLLVEEPFDVAPPSAMSSRRSLPRRGRDSCSAR